MEIRDEPKYIKKIGPFSGRSSVMKQVYKQIRKAAAVDAPILLQNVRKLRYNLLCVMEYP